MKKLQLALAAAGLLAASAAQAAINVDFTVTWAGGVYGTGSFAGTDSNANDLLEFSELASFAFVSPPFGHDINLANLVDTGDYKISTNVWMANGISWVGNPDDAFFTWNSRGNSVNSTWATLETRVPVVPEPTTWAMMGLGLAALGAVARRRAR